MLSAYSSESLQRDASEVSELLFETHLILDVQTNIHTAKASLQKLLIKLQ